MEQRAVAGITQIARGSFHDGPGLRTVVYLKGCSLSCLWCHNPETVLAGNEIAYLADRCIRCGRCVQVCPQDCHAIGPTRHDFDRSRCTTCLACAAACPNEALTAVARDMSVEAVFAEVEKDRHFYEASGGGVTLSGGECLLAPAFASGLLARCRAEGIHTAVESALDVPSEHLAVVVPLVDLFLVDLKLWDPEIHRRLTGVGNERILCNLGHLASVHGNLWIRVPLIPGLTDPDANLDGIARIVGTLGDGVRRVELLRYNDLARLKYASLGRVAPLPGLRPQSDVEMAEKAQRFRKASRAGLEVGFI